MKITHVLKYFHPRVTGVTSYVAELSRELVKAGRDVSILTWGEGLGEEERDGARVVRVPFHDMRALGAALAAEKPDAVHVHGIWRHAPASAWTCRRLGIPLIITIHGSWMFLNSTAGFESPWRRLRFLLYRRTIWRAVLASAAAVIALNDPEERNLLSMGLPPSRIHRIPNAVNPGDFHVPPPPGSGESAGGFAGLFAGAVQTQKGVFTLMEAMSLAIQNGVPATLTVCGDGPDAARCREKASALGLGDAVGFPGAVPREDMPRRFSQADFFVLPSANEPFGTAFLEAMAAGLPCIGSDCGGTPEIIEDGVTGLLAPYGDAPALARRMETLWSDRERACAMGEAGRRRVEERFAWPVVAGRIMDAYDRATA